MRKFKFLKSKEVQEIITAYPHVKASILAEKHGVPVSKIYSTAKRYNVKKSPEFLASTDSGRIQRGRSLSPETRFKKGTPSPRKGKKMSFSSEEKKSKSAACRWKKGNIPPNIAQAGEIRFRPGFGYYYVKISDNNWELYHRWLWEQHNGPIPPKMVVCHIDGNVHNKDISNLKLISMTENAIRNKSKLYTEENSETLVLMSKIKKKIKTIECNGKK